MPYYLNISVASFRSWRQFLDNQRLSAICKFCGRLARILIFDYLEESDNDWRKNMKVYVDADACPVVKIIERIAKKYDIPCILLCDTNHVMYSDYSEVVTVGAGADAVDFKLVSLIQRGDICVTQDYGVAAMILGKGAYGIHQSGKWYTNENIDRLLMQRHITKKVRRSSKKNHLKGPAKRTAEDDAHFEQSFEKLVATILQDAEKQT